MEYQALNHESNEIRVLQFVRTSAHTTTQMDYEAKEEVAGVGMLNLTLNNRPLSDTDRNESRNESGSFLALSYTWGTTEDMREIVVNNSKITIRRNLYQALKVLQSHYLVCEGNSMWTDALCINQNNANEVHDQIKRMGAIYKQAHRVVVWLGDAADNSDLAMDFINAFNDLSDAGELPLRKSLRHFLSVHGVDIWDALSQLMSREYWSRLWIIQELAMGGTSTIIICGHKTTTWERFFRVYDSTHTHKHVYRDARLATIFREELSMSGLEVLDAYDRVKLWVWEKSENYQIIMEDVRRHRRSAQEHLLARMERAKCFKVVDKVYGTLGLLDEAISKSIVPNYDIPSRDVFIAFAEAWIQAEMNLELLIHGGETGNGDEWRKLDELDLPSWVPDLRKQTMVQYNVAHPKPHAAGSQRASFTFLGNSVLSTQGIILSAIDGLSERQCWNEDPAALQSIVNAKHDANAYGSASAFREALWRTFVGDRDYQAHSLVDDTFQCFLDVAVFDAPAPTKAQYRSDHIDYQSWLKTNASFVLGGKPLKQHFLPLKSIEHEPDVYYSCLRCFFLGNRRLSVTVSGHIALVSQAARVGDVVAILFGCSVPLLLRPVEHMFRVVAECYVQGVMQGELAALVSQENPAYLKRDILLC